MHVKLRPTSVSVNTENVKGLMMYALRKGACLDFCNGSVYAWKLKNVFCTDESCPSSAQNFEAYVMHYYGWDMNETSDPEPEDADAAASSSTSQLHKKKANKKVSKRRKRSVVYAGRQGSSLSSDDEQ